MKTGKALAVAAILLIVAAIIAVFFRGTSLPDASRNQIRPQMPKEAQSVADTPQTPSGTEAKFLDPVAAGKSAAVPAVPASGGGGGGGKRTATTQVPRSAMDYQPADINAEVRGDAAAAPPSPGNGGGGSGKSVETEPFFDRKLGHPVKVVKGEIMVRFRQGLTDEEINRVIAELGATKIEKNEERGIYRLRIPAAASVSAFIDAHAKNRNLTLSVPNVVASSLNDGPTSPQP